MTALGPFQPRPAPAVRRRRSRSWGSVLAAATLLATACTSPAGLAEPGPAPPPRPVPEDAVGPLTVSAAARPGSSSAMERSWARSFVGMQERLSGPAGVAIYPVGSTRSADLLEVGRWKTGVAWSTSKVPVTVAAQRESESKTIRARSKRAITISDNQAAERLWASLGRPREAAALTQDVIRDAGDKSTVVQRRRVRAGFTAFGQTKWDLDDQARFAAGLSCMSDAKDVVRLMDQVTRSQRWGLGRLPRTKFKGGWGPVGRGYLVRQLGIHTLADGSQVGIAIAVSARSFSTGTRDLTVISGWLGKRLGGVEGGSCPRR